MSSNEISPEKVLQLTGGAQATAVLGTAVAHEVFTRLEAAPLTPEQLATAAKISPRGARALLDGLVGLGLVTVADGRYANAPEASTFLVEGKPASLTGLARVALGGMAGWAKLPEAVATGA